MKSGRVTAQILKREHPRSAHHSGLCLLYAFSDVDIRGRAEAGHVAASRVSDYKQYV